MLTNDIVLICGKSGSGKSFFAGWFAWKFKRRGKALVLWDRKNEYRGLAKHLLVLDRALFARIKEEGHGVLRAVIDTFESVRITPQSLTLDELLEAFDALAQAIYERGQTVLLVEEAHVVMPQGQTPRWAQILVTDARTNANDLIMVTQRVQLLDTTAASQANVRVCFKMTDLNDLKRVASYFTNPLPATHGDVGSFIASMMPFQALYVNEKNGAEGTIHTTRIKDFRHFG